MSMNMDCVRDVLVRRGCTDQCREGGGLPSQLTCGENGCRGCRNGGPFCWANRQLSKIPQKPELAKEYFHASSVAVHWPFTFLPSFLVPWTLFFSFHSSFKQNVTCNTAMNSESDFACDWMTCVLPWYDLGGCLDVNIIIFSHSVFKLVTISYHQLGKSKTKSGRYVNRSLSVVVTWIAH